MTIKTGTSLSLALISNMLILNILMNYSLLGFLLFSLYLPITLNNNCFRL